MSRPSFSLAARLITASLLASTCVPAMAQTDSPVGSQAPDQAATIADLQRQIDELKAMVSALQATQPAPSPGPAPIAAAAPAPAQPAPVSAPPAPVAIPLAAATPKPKREAWYEKLRLRGYTQMRFNQIVSGDADAPAGVSRLRSIHDSAVNGDSNFTFRRMQLVLQGDLNEHVSLYFQPDFAAAVSNQSVGERREGTVSLRDMYADVFPTGDKSFRIRLGQSKVP